MIKAWLTIWILLFSVDIWATSLRVRLNNKNPVIGEEVKLIFEIETQSTSEPDISFTPYNAEVLGKTNNGLSIRTTIINGKISTQRSMSYVYRIVVPKAGTFRINEIEVTVDGKTYHHPNLVGNALKEARKPKSIFVLAIPSKTVVYQGEGITVDYYLYFKVPVRGVEIETFPKLNNFIKRFQQPKDNVERVEYKGEIFRRLKKYSARIYPQKVGTVYIDTLALRVAYQRRVNRFDPFGMSSTATKTVYSKKIPIEVKPIPALNVPKDYIGLVGDHKVSFSINRSKFLVNEAIEARLTVEGPGELENLAPFKIYENPYLESFDIKENLEELPNGMARKTFDYTFLGRRNVNISASDYTYSYFDPATGRFKQKKLHLPALIIEGTAHDSNYAGSSSPPPNISGVENKITNQAVPSGLVAPLFTEIPQGDIARWQQWIIYFLSSLILILSLLIIRRSIVEGMLDHDDEFTKSYKLVLKEKSYETLYNFLSFFITKEGMSIEETLKQLDLEEDTKEYFADLLKRLEMQKYSKNTKQRKIKLSSKQFKKIYKAYYQFLNTK